MIRIWLAAHDAHRGRCALLLYAVERNAESVDVRLGTLVDPPSIRPSAYRLVCSMASCHTVSDNLPRHAEFD